MNQLIEQFFTFVVHHWLLSAGVVIILILIVLEESKKKISGVQKISPQETITLINRENAVVVDIRDVNAYSNGHIVNAISLPNDQLETHIEKISKYKDQPVIIVCSAGQTGITAAIKLRKLGFQNIHSLGGGLQAWRSASFPLTKT